MRVFWTPDAVARLHEIEANIAGEVPDAARGVIVRLIRRTADLEQSPKLGRRLRLHHDVDLRELLERPYRLIYRVSTERVEIITVMHYRQLLPSDLTGAGRG